ncbi:MAG: CNNM domain-containing protein [Planctomycetota bacterium]
MTLGLEIVGLIACLIALACFAGGETALYSISRVRVEMEARQNRLFPRLLRRLLSDDVALLVVLLIGNTLAVELLTFQSEHLAELLHLPETVAELALPLVLTPIVFLFGEALPKELFRRRPHAFLTPVTPFLYLARIVFWPLERLLGSIARGAARLLGLKAELVAVVSGRETVRRLLRESALAGELPPQAEQIAQNVLKLRTIRVERAMVPWSRVGALDARKSQAELYTNVARSPYTRLPVHGPKGELLGYVHQLDVLGAGPGVQVLDHLRPLVELPPHTPVDQALARLRAAGQRLAIVGTRERPEGLLTLKDLVEEISGDLAGW